MNETTIDNINAIFLKAFLNNSEFRNLFISNWKKEYFDLIEERIIYIIIKNIWETEHKILSKKDLELEFANKSKYEKYRIQLFQCLNEIYNINLSEYTDSYIRDYFFDILKKKNIKNVISDVVNEINKSGKIDENAIKNDLLKSLDIINDGSDLGIDYFNDDVCERMKILQEMQITHFKTGLDKDLDDILKLKRKTVVAVSAQLGVGKSLFLNNISCSFAKSGYNVLYLSLEMDSYDITKRLDKILMNFEDDYYFQDVTMVKDKMNKIKKENKLGKLFVISKPPRTLTAFSIRNILEQYRLKNIGIDIICVDYLTLMRPTRNLKDDNMYMRGKEISEELQAIAKDKNILIFTALQVKADSYNRITHSADAVAESLAIPQNLDTLISLQELIFDDCDNKFFIVSFEKTRDSKRSNKKIYFKLSNSLKIINITDEEKTKIDEHVRSVYKISSKSTEMNVNKKTKKDKETSLDDIFL